MPTATYRKPTKNLHQSAQHATAGNRIHYERHRPEETVLYQLVQENVETFLHKLKLKLGRGYPILSKMNSMHFLNVAPMAHGFLRLRCASCAHDKLVAYSCKRRGFCLSCGGRRMAQTAAYLVDHIIPRVPVRQWVLSLPIPLRYLLAAHPRLITPVLQVIHRAISTFLIKQAGLKRIEAQTGAITLIQRFGSAANLNIHLHCLVLDGVYRIQNGVAEFHSARLPTAEQLRSLLSQIIWRIMKALTRNGALIEEEGMSYLAEIETDAALAPLQSAACTYRIALTALNIP
ncbi:transposase zinc-binding domain-containing protein [Nitrosomonas sp. ANs5]|uniref:transposase zinc-binding domain-containing protein n=1 Tax=Nitrosomonas sp. ANs5 TaxID=3423941 RepID=UPI003D3509CE